MNRYSKVKHAIIIVLSSFVATNAWAQAYSNTMSMLSVSLNLLFGLCVITGVLFIGIAFTRYQQFRQNPSETPLNRVFFVLFFGVAMLFLPYVAKKATTHQVIQEVAVTAEK